MAIEVIIKSSATALYSVRSSFSRIVEEITPTTGAVSTEMAATEADSRVRSTAHSC